MTQNYHRYLNLPFTIDKPESFKELKENDYVIMKDNSIIPSMVVDWLDTFGLFSIHTEAFFTAPNDSIDIHCDTLEIDNNVKINFTWGSNKSTTRWWKLKEGRAAIQHRNSKDGGGLLLAKEHDCDLIFEQVIDRPSLINAGVLHSTHNPTEQSRWTLSVVIGHKDRPNKLLQWDDAYEILKDYIDETRLS
jgi:hypothetical protein